MSKLLARLAGYLRNRTLVGVDKVGNRYFTRTEEIDGIMKEKRWVVFKGEEDPTSLPVEWICWLNGQRKRAPTPECMFLTAKVLKQEEEERRAKEGSSCKSTSTDKTGGPDLKSFIRQFPTASEGNKLEEESDAVDRASAQFNLLLQPRMFPSLACSKIWWSAPRFNALSMRPCMGIQNQLDRAQPSSQGHGSHRHEMDYIVMLTWFEYMYCKLLFRKDRDSGEVRISRIGYEDCVRILRSDHRAIKATNVKELAYIILDLCIANATVTLGEVPKLQEKHKKDGQIEKALRRCAVEYERATKVYFRKAVEQLGTKSYLEAQNSAHIGGALVLGTVAEGIVSLLRLNKS
ncbi:hypothetical protein SADUNF_Sadunf03G0090400 [Salix dunnii]|uniref:NADH dehydrogenase [ubiquinone] 1 alpha subcomplex subunit 12 n=1 Tax=Salix dunnii TaxID=1413687 RepID=A0A835K7X4_9ROSI|nr:hypothetical protein SADUNF_Sadunf03G0090400 [Salix dunnii]